MLLPRQYDKFFQLKTYLPLKDKNLYKYHLFQNVGARFIAPDPLGRNELRPYVKFLNWI